MVEWLDQYWELLFVRRMVEQLALLLDILTGYQKVLQRDYNSGATLAVSRDYMWECMTDYDLVVVMDLELEHCLVHMMAPQMEQWTDN